MKPQEPPDHLSGEMRQKPPDVLSVSILFCPQSINQLNQCFSYRNTVHRHSHVDVRGLEAALVDVVVGEGLGWVGAVLIHGDGDLPLGGYSASHGTSGWGMSRSQRCSGDPVSKHPLVPRLGSESPYSDAKMQNVNDANPNTGK